MRVLAIDPGYDRLGIAILDKDEKGLETLLFSACVTTDSKSEFPDRLNKVVLETKKAMEEFSPDALSIEKLYITKNQKTAMRVAEVRGAIIQSARENGLEVFEYTPLQIKIAVGGHGKSDKKQIISMVPRLIDLKEKKIKYDDEYDAIAIGLTCLAIEKRLQ
ncbi:MAG: crossover junction endodeoxyribonuclease RuvC [Candidatus Pacebacteria bacterium]|jgi:crossover junction endodeoxyribonuclease RuvC|nr:crossover junction endodeoxyribonuclease RuvC [bacterium]MDP6527971.1 crossover junction endodeoxyribonuclease RuvC [Candidatus Paceibacterota bacterium]MDP6659770.1 crossover junction endodeoxyribonuclease RuvC [Candidatus Paceibacterota bacterium]|tara:strand:- start:297 stop:782 length:486 start_codon:yes stop_codon:yes gene_type:complete